MSEDEQRRILRLLAIEKEQRRSHESLKKWATENFAIFGHWKRAAEIKERAAENFSVPKSAPAKACSKKCTAGSKVWWLGWCPLVVVCAPWWFPMMAPPPPWPGINPPHINTSHPNALLFNLNSWICSRSKHPAGSQRYENRAFSASSDIHKSDEVSGQCQESHQSWAGHLVWYQRLF